MSHDLSYAFATRASTRFSTRWLKLICFCSCIAPTLATYRVLFNISHRNGLHTICRRWNNKVMALTLSPCHTCLLAMCALYEKKSRIISRAVRELFDSFTLTLSCFNFHLCSVTHHTGIGADFFWIFSIECFSSRIASFTWIYSCSRKFHLQSPSFSRMFGISFDFGLPRCAFSLSCFCLIPSICRSPCSETCSLSQKLQSQFWLWTTCRLFIAIDSVCTKWNWNWQCSFSNRIPCRFARARARVFFISYFYGTDTHYGCAAIVQ